MAKCLAYLFIYLILFILHPWWLKIPRAGDLGLSSGWGRSPGEGNGNPLQYSCLENPHGQRSLAGYSPWGCKEWDTNEHTHTPAQTHLLSIHHLSVIYLSSIILLIYLSIIHNWNLLHLEHRKQNGVNESKHLIFSDRILSLYKRKPVGQYLLKHR